MKNIRIALAVTSSKVGNTEGNLARMAEWIALAAKGGASLVCFPEANITGYSNRPEIRTFAQPIPGEASRRLNALAVQEKITILSGLVETNAAGRLFLTHLIATPNGLIDVYRKTHIAPSEKEIFFSGEALPLFKTEAATFGIQLCYDAHFPELSTHMALQGADIIFFPHASPRGTPDEKLRSWLRHLSARAFDNGLFVAAVNQTGENGLGLSFPGLAVVIGPDGEIIAQNTSGQETLLFADLSAEALEQIHRHPMRYFLPYRRPEIYGNTA